MIRLITPDDKDKDEELHIHMIKNTKETTNVPLLNNGKKIEELTLSDPGVYTEILSDGTTIDWVLPHKRQFPDFINKYFGENPKYISDKEMFLTDIAESTDDSPPFSYQILIRDYLRFGTPYRALLLEHGLGSGKSRSAIMVAETFRAQGLKTLILTPAFLRLNFMDEIHKWGESDIKITHDMATSEVERRQRLINKSYQFVHYNATGYSVGATDKTGRDIGGKGGVFEQLAQIGIGFPSDSKYGKLFPYLTEKYGELSPPTNRLIIIEEIHNMNRTFVAGNTKSNLKFYLYPLLLMASDCKIIGLSGTPIISTPFEMATLYSILRGPINVGHDTTAYTLPQSETVFNEAFINFEQLTLINKEILMSRIIGLGSLFKGVTDDIDRIIFPAGKDSPIKRELVMSEYQSKVHDFYLTEEDAPKSRKSRTSVNLTGSHGGPRSDAQNELEPDDAAYHTNSRQAINFAFPEDIERPRPRVKVDFNSKGLKDYVFEFRYNSDRIYDELKKLKVDLSSVKMTGTEEDKIQKLSNIFKLANSKLPDSKSPTWGLLSQKDQELMITYSEPYQLRLNKAIKKLTDNSDKYFTIENLKKYSVKMADIYLHITGDIEHGACHLVDDSVMESVPAEEKEYEESLIEPEIGEKDDDMEEDSVLNLKTITITNDPDDPLNGYMDVFKSDSELKAMNKRVKGGPALVYSFFNTVEGAGIFSKILESHGFAQFTESTWNGMSDIEEMKRMPRYAFIKGGMNTNLKAKIMRVFNHRANRHGQLIRVIFATQAAAEGISLYHLRQIHIMEPHWDNVLIEQVIGRGFRLRSHKYLADKTEREIQIYQYYAMGHDSADYSGTNTIDYRIQAIADRKSKLVSQLKLVRGAAAIDCKINREYNNLKIQCFDFRGNSTGDAFKASIDRDLASNVQSTRKIETEIKYGYFEVKGKTFVKYHNQHVKIQITNPKGEKKEYNAEVVYSPPASWKVNDSIDPKDFQKYGYVVFKDNGDNALIPLNPNIKEV